MTTNLRSILAEFIGTFALVFVGTAVATLHAFFDYGDGGPLMIAAAFGGTLAVLVIAIGPVSGCHVNPAVTIPMALAGKLPAAVAPAYIVAQVLGAVAASAAVFAIAGAVPGYELGIYGNGANGNPFEMDIAGVLGIETLLTALFVLVIFGSTRSGTAPAASAIAIGGFLFLAHLVAIPLDGTSLNPARSIGPAVFAGADALSLLWIFIAGPIAGGLIGLILYKFVFPPENSVD